MSAQTPPSLGRTAFADFSDYFRKDSRGGKPNPNYRGFKTLFCKNCGQFVSERYASNHDAWHDSQNFEDIYRRKVEGRRIA